MTRGRTGPLPVDQFARRINDQVIAAAALDDDKACSAMLKVLASYLESKELEIRQTAWDAPPSVNGHSTSADAFAGEPMRSRFDSTCAVCQGRIQVGAAIVYNREIRRAAHEGCAGGGAT